MSQSQVVSFRASGHFLNWIETQRLDGESMSQAAQRILKEISCVHGNYKLYTTSGNPVCTPPADLSTPPVDKSTTNSHSVMSTNNVDTMDKVISSHLDPVMERMAAIEERLGKLSA